MTSRNISWIQVGAMAFAAAMSGPVAAQDEPAAPVADLAAAEAFDSLVKSLRAQPDLAVKTTLTIQMLEGEIASSTQEVKAEFIYRSDGAGVIKLRGMTTFVRAGVFTATHESTQADSYFTQPFDGQPYWVFLDAFRDMPFPHLGLLWGDEAMEDVYMELHPMTPELVPTAVREQAGEQGATKTIVMTDPNGSLELSIDAGSLLPIAAKHEITGGVFVQEGVRMVSTYVFENTVGAKPRDDREFTLEVGDRQRVDMLATLVDVPPPAPPPGGGGAEIGRAGAGLIGQPAPHFVLATADGGAIDLAELRGQVVVLDFWATWCGPCRVGLPLLHEVAAWARRESLPVTVITINTIEITDPARDSPDARLEAVNRFWKEKQFTLPVAMDYADQTSRAYGVQGIPTTVVIRSDGVVHYAHAGVLEVEALKAQITEAITALEGAPAADGPAPADAEDAGGNE